MGILLMGTAVHIYAKTSITINAIKVLITLPLAHILVKNWQLSSKALKESLGITKQSSHSNFSLLC